MTALIILSLLAVGWLMIRTVSRFITATLMAQDHDHEQTKPHGAQTLRKAHETRLYQLHMLYHRARTATEIGAIAVADQLEAEIRDLAAADHSHSSNND